MTMNAKVIQDLSELRNIRQILAAKPPRIVRGTLLILAALLGAAATWLSVTKVNLVVKSMGRVRPVT
jgi:hypothetical protein